MQPEIHDVRKSPVTYKAIHTCRNYIILFLTVIKFVIVVKQFTLMVNYRLGAYHFFAHICTHI